MKAPVLDHPFALEAWTVYRAFLLGGCRLLSQPITDLPYPGASRLGQFQCCTQGYAGERSKDEEGHNEPNEDTFHLSLTSARRIMPYIDLRAVFRRIVWRIAVQLRRSPAGA